MSRRGGSGALRRICFWLRSMPALRHLLYVNRSGPIGLDLFTVSPRFETKNFGEQPYLDTSATFDEANQKADVSLYIRFSSLTCEYSCSPS
jgi:hypothetical protein